MAKNLFTRRSFLFILIIFSLSFSVWGCKEPSQEEAPTSLPDPTPTIAPTQAPDRAVLAASSVVNAEEISQAQVVIASLAAGSGLEFETREVILPNEITPDVKIIVFLEQPDNLGTLASGAPGTQFVAISSQEWNPPANGSIIRISNDYAAFLAGYAGAMLAPNFRVGALQASENSQFNLAFRNGVSYYCGICAALVYPLVTYPVVSTQPAASPPANWQAAFNEINVNRVNVLFLPKEASSPELAAFLAAQDVGVIGNAPPSEELRSKWIATISSDGLAALQEIWADLAAGNGGKVVNASLKFSDLNYVTVGGYVVGITTGKMQQINEMIQLLRSGQIYPYSVMP